MSDFTIGQLQLPHSITAGWLAGCSKNLPKTKMRLVAIYVTLEMENDLYVSGLSYAELAEKYDRSNFYTCINQRINKTKYAKACAKRIGSELFYSTTITELCKIKGMPYTLWQLRKMKRDLVVAKYEKNNRGNGINEKKKAVEKIGSKQK